MWFKPVIVTVIEVVVAAGCANKEDAYVSLGDTTVLRTVFDVERRTQISVQNIEVAGLYTSRRGGQVGVWGVGWARVGWHPMRCPPPGRSTCKGQGVGVRGQLGRDVWQWVSARESSIAPDGLELICARQLGGW